MVNGTVRNATDSHVYVLLDGQVEGVIHVSQLAHEHVDRASDAVGESTELTLSGLGFNDDRRQVELSLKALLVTPYETFKASHNNGDTIRADVRNDTKTHAYLDLDEGVTVAIFFATSTTTKLTTPQFTRRPVPTSSPRSSSES